MHQQSQPRGPGQSSLAFGQPSLLEAPSSARISGLDGLAQKKLPDRAGAHLKALTYWSSFMPREGDRSALRSPALYIDRGDPDSPQMRLLAPYGKQAALAMRCHERFVLSSRRIGLQGEGVPACQQALRPRVLYTLSHLISGVRHPVAGVGLYPSGVRNGQPLMLVEPSPMLSRLGYAICGDNYRALEQDYAELACCMVQYQKWDHQKAEWALAYEEPLIDYFDTGRRCFSRGREVDTSQRRRRYRNWRLGLSRPLIEMLKCRASEFAGFTPELWRAAGQSSAAQWLVCYLSGHGYDAGEFLPHRLDTLAYRMRACPDDMLEDLRGSSLEVADFLAQSNSASARRATEAQFSQDAVDRAKAYDAAAAAFNEEKRSLRAAIRRVFRGVKRLASSNLFSSVSLVGGGNQEAILRDVSAQGVFRAVSEHDRLTLRRWPAAIERHLRSIPCWMFSEYRSLLDAAGKAVATTTIRSSDAKACLSAILNRLHGLQSTSSMARHLVVRLAWLSESVWCRARALVFSPVCLEGSPPYARGLLAW